MLPNIYYEYKSWYKVKLSDVLINRDVKSTKKDDLPLVSFTSHEGVVEKTDRYNREQLIKGNKDNKKYKITKYNDIIYNPANLKFGAISRNTYGSAVLSPIYITFMVNNKVVYPEFIENILINWDFINKALKYQEGTVYERQSVKLNDFLSLEVYITDLNNQYYISKYFDIWNKFIKLYKTKLESLKLLRKFFLKHLYIDTIGCYYPKIRFKEFNDAWEKVS